MNVLDIAINCLCEEIPLHTVLACTRLVSVGSSGSVSPVYQDQFLWFHQGVTSDTRLGPNQGGKAGKQFHLTALCHHKLPDSPGITGTNPYRKRPKNPNFGINRKKPRFLL